MKLKNTKLIALLAMAGLAISATSAKAITNGDLVFGVRDTDGTNNNVYLFDLGTAASLPTTGSQTYASALGADLTALFGSTWYSNTNLQWSVSGYNGTNTVFASEVESTYGAQSTPIDSSTITSSNRNTIKTDINNVDTQYNGASSTTGGGKSTLNSVVNGYASYMPGYGTFDASFEGSGFSGQALDIYKINGQSAANVAYEGTFTVDAAGDVIFSAAPPVTATPEAGSAFTLMSLGLGCLVTMRRRLAGLCA